MVECGGSHARVIVYTFLSHFLVLFDLLLVARQSNEKFAEILLSNKKFVFLFIALKLLVRFSRRTTLKFHHKCVTVFAIDLL